MTFRARLTLFFVGIVAAPLIVGAVVAADASRTQAVRDADARLQLAAVTATDSLQLERARVGRLVSPSFALRAYRAGSADDLDRLRQRRRLDFLVVSGPGGVIRESVDLPAGVTASPAQIADGSLQPVAADRTVVIRGADGARVVGGRMWRSNVPPTIGVSTALLLDGHPIGDGDAPVTTSPRPVTADGHRVVCLCPVGATTSGLVLSTPSHAAGLSRWFRWPAIGLVLAGLAVLVGLAYLLARMLTRPLVRLAEEVAAVARGEPDVQAAVDPAAGRELYQVATTLQTVSQELSGSRGELERTRGRLAAAERLTLIDPLTGVWNRRYLERTLREQVKRFERFSSPFSVLVMDIDRFKAVNDRLGHAVGDEVLTQVAHTIDGSIRGDIDVLARYGGEEFVAVLPETDAAGAIAAAEKIRSIVADSAFESEGERMSVTISIGVAACPQDARDDRAVFLAADAAMYRAKAAGRNRWMAASGADASAR